MSITGLMSVSDDKITFAAQENTRTILVDCVSESIAVKQVTGPATFYTLSNWWQRIKLAKLVRTENPGCAVYWVKLSDGNRLLCVSDLSLSHEVSDRLEHAIGQAATVSAMHSQAMCIASAIPEKYQHVLLLLGTQPGIRHLCIISGRPVFCRHLQSVVNHESLVQALRETQQHLINRSLLDTPHAVVCHGLSFESINALAIALPDTEVLELSAVLSLNNDNADTDQQSVASLASSVYRRVGWRGRWVSPLPAYWLTPLKRYRYVHAARLFTCSAVCLLVLMVAGSAAVFNNDWMALLSARNSINNTLPGTSLLQQKAQTFSAAPQLTAQRLRRLDLLRQQQALSPDVLLAGMSSVFEAHPSIRLNHISWFVVSADSDFKSQTRISARQGILSDTEFPDQLSVLISGEVSADTLSKRQATFALFQEALLAINGVGNLTSLKTPLSQWQIDDNDTQHNAPQLQDNFTIRFSLDANSS